MTDAGTILNNFYAAVIKRDLSTARRYLAEDLVTRSDPNQTTNTKTPQASVQGAVLYSAINFYCKSEWANT